MEEKDLKKLPRCKTCEADPAKNYPENEKHDFNTYDHPYNDPNKVEEKK